MRRLINALLGCIFIAAAYTEEIAEGIADWADQKLIDRKSEEWRP